jgi:outer membrane protein TolC
VQGARLEAQATEQYWFFYSALQRAQHDLFEAERNLRWLMGIPPTDRRVIRPADEPISAQVDFDWLEIRTESLFRSPELIQQKWRLKQRELELKGAKNQLLPRLNATLNYRWLGLGDDLINADRNGINFPNTGSTAFDELFEGNFQEATMGLEFTPPQFGARRPLAAIRHAQLELARAKAVLEDQELQQVHLLSSAVSNAALNHAQTITNFNRWMAAQRDVQMATALYEGGKESLDQVLQGQGQRQRAQAQIEFYRSLVEYNKALADIHFRKGSLLEHNGIHMEEGPWPEKAYWDAIERARERDASYYLHYGWTRPGRCESRTS